MHTCIFIAHTKAFSFDKHPLFLMKAQAVKLSFLAREQTHKAKGTTKCES